jgi:hypothetical protein
VNKTGAMLSQILHWAEQQTNIRSVLMVGSRANNGKQDDLSDYDLSIFGNQFDFIARTPGSAVSQPIPFVYTKNFIGEIGKYLPASSSLKTIARLISPFIPYHFSKIW